MKRSTKIWLTVALLLIVVGSILLSVFLSAFEWGNSKEFEEKTYTTEKAFENILVDVDAADVFIKLSTDWGWRVNYCEDVKRPVSVKVENNTLIVQEQDERAWYEYMGIHLTRPRIEIEVPRKALDSLKIQAVAGDIVLNDHSINSLNLSASAGDICLNNITCAGNMDIHLTTGGVYLSGVTCQNFTTQGSTGDVCLSNTVIADTLSIRRSTGDIDLTSTDAAHLILKTTTGDITCSLLTDKVYETHTTTGEIHIPQSGGNGKCEVTTTTGDIAITVCNEKQ